MQNATSLGGKTALQRHVAFFDPDDTGVVTLGQTWAGLGALGIAVHWRLLLTPIINGFLGYLTQRRPSFRIVVAKIAEGKHPFDSGSFGDDGAVDEAAYATLAAAATLGSLTAKEMRALIVARGNRRPHMGKLAGALGSWFSGKEVRLFFCLAADATKQEDGVEVPSVTPRTLRRLYDGTLFYALARRRRMVAGGVRFGRTQ
jgi:Caleosin related protein